MILKDGEIIENSHIGVTKGFQRKHGTGCKRKCKEALYAFMIIK